MHTTTKPFFQIFGFGCMNPFLQFSYVKGIFSITWSTSILLLIVSIQVRILLPFLLRVISSITWYINISFLIASIQVCLGLPLVLIAPLSLFLLHALCCVHRTCLNHLKQFPFIYSHSLISYKCTHFLSYLSLYCHFISTFSFLLHSFFGHFS